MMDVFAMGLLRTLRAFPVELEVVASANLVDVQKEVLLVQEAVFWTEEVEGDWEVMGFSLGESLSEEVEEDQRSSRPSLEEVGGVWEPHLFLSHRTSPLWVFYPNQVSVFLSGLGLPYHHFVLGF